MVAADKTPAKNSSTIKRRLRRKKLSAARAVKKSITNQEVLISTTVENNLNLTVDLNSPQEIKPDTNPPNLYRTKENLENMSSKEDNKSREEVIAARETKKLAKQKGKSKPAQSDVIKTLDTPKSDLKKDTLIKNTDSERAGKEDRETINQIASKPSKSKDEVDKAVIQVKTDDSLKVDVLAERAAKKAAKQAKKKKEDGGGSSSAENMTVKDVVETLKDIVSVAKEFQDVTAKVQAINLEPKKTEESGKSKADLRAERRAKQEAQRAAKQATVQQKVATTTSESKAKVIDTVKPKEEKAAKVKSVEKTKTKQRSVNRVNWFQHLHMQQDKESLKKIPINSNLHPAIIKLGVQLATRVVSGSNARCIALLDALKKMVRDYTLPAKTEFGRGLEAHLAASLEFLWNMRQPSASQTNAVKSFRYHLTQLPNNVDEFDAKKTLQEEIDRYIREQIDMAAEAISLTVRNKISNGDNILTYGCSSLIERILCEAWSSGLRFRAVVVGTRTGAAAAARDMLRRLASKNVTCDYLDITAVSYIMPTINKVLLSASALLANGSVLGAAGTAQVTLVANSLNINKVLLSASALLANGSVLGAAGTAQVTLVANSLNINKVLLSASALLANGSVLGAAGTAQVALVADSLNVPVLVACETHKFSERVQTDAFVYNEIGDPDELVDKTDENSPIKDWRSNPNLTPLNLTYDVTPPSLVTAVVTELAILPCTSAPVVLRFKLSEYGI